MLLNPEIIFQNGEWGVWFFAPWFPGAVRYQSFIESIQDIQKSIVEQPKIRELLYLESYNKAIDIHKIKFEDLKQKIFLEN